MTIRAITTHYVYSGPHRNWTLVKIATNEGSKGWCQTTDEGTERPKQFGKAAEQTVEQGFTALKWDPFGGVGLFIEHEQEEIAVAIVREVRNAVGPKIDLLVEVHGRLSPANAIRIGHRLAEF